MPLSKRSAAPSLASPAAVPRRAAGAPTAGPASRLRCACGGPCPNCVALRSLQRRALLAPADSPFEAAADRAADAALRRPGAARAAAGGPAALQAFFGPALSGVRLHRSAAADADARALGAGAFTLGRDIVLGPHAPRTGAAGLRLMAHELAHVAQQRQGAPVQVQRTGEFAPAYKQRDGEVRSHLQVKYDDYKAGLGPTQATSASGGHRFAIGHPITLDELRQIFPGLADDIDQGVLNESMAQAYLGRVNRAFAMFKIDTVEAQGAFLANARHESAQFRFMTETEGAMPGAKPYAQDPTAVALNTDWLDKAAVASAENKLVAQGKKTPEQRTVKMDVVNYESGGSINPRNDWQQSFIGRGPIQATHRHLYVQTIAVMEHRLEELEATDPDSAEAVELREAVVKIKEDPRQAANPRYAFLFSTALLKMPDDAGRRGDVKATRPGGVTSWMGQQPAAVAKAKQSYYDDALKVLMPKWQAEEAEAGQDGG